jgi:RNA polymerase sigma factor (sigma-70 family)
MRASFREVSARGIRSDQAALSDDALVAGMAAGDDAAGTAFVRRHQRRVFGIARAITTDRAVAEEVAQEAFLRAWRHAAVFDPRRASAVAWLSAITRNLAIDAVRIRRTVPVDPGDVLWATLTATSADQTASPEAVVERNDATARVERALNEVPPAQRRALLRAAFFGQTAAEIAAAEQVPLGTAKSRVRLGLARVREALERGDLR